MTPLLDRFGRKRALQAGVMIFGGASLAVLAIASSDQLIAVRTLMGVGGAMILGCLPTRSREREDVGHVGYEPALR